MHNFTYETQGTSRFLVYSIEEEITIDTISLGMLTNNDIKGLLNVSFMQLDKMRFFKYNVTSMIPLKQYFSGVVNKSKLLTTFYEIIEPVLSAEDYMIDINTIVFDSDYVFVDIKTGKISLVCTPIIGDASVKADPLAFFKQIMFNTNFDQTENCDYVAKLINYVNNGANFSFANFLMLLDSLKNSVSVERKPNTYIPTGVNTTTGVNTMVGTNETTVISNAPNVPQKVIATDTVKNGFATQLNNKVPIKKETSEAIIPPKVKTPKTQISSSEDSCEKKITMMQLLMHYNKENAELYKKQKENKKNSNVVSSQGKQNTSPMMPKMTKSNKNVNQPRKTMGFDIPGQVSSIADSNPPTNVNESNDSPEVNSSPVTSMPVYNYQNTPKFQTMNYGETTILGNAGETTVLTDNTPFRQRIDKKVACLIRLKTGEQITMDKPVFRIGKERAYVDYFIGDNTAISRSHANIINRNGEFFIEDMNSTNHTYINGSIIQSNVEIKLLDGCVIRLANEDFNFKIIKA